MSGRDPRPPIDGLDRRENAGRGKAWFVYTRVPGRFSASPVSIEGWMVVLGLPALGLVMFFAAGQLIPPKPVLHIVLGLVLLAAVLVATFAIARAKGRPFH